MIAAFPPLPPVIDQTIQTTPLTAASALCFVAITVVAAYCAWRRSPWIASTLAFFVPFAAYRDVWHTTMTIEKCLVFGAVLGLLVGGAPLVPQSRGARRIFWVAVVMLATISLSTLNAVYHGNAAREFFKQTEYLMLFWCAATFVERIPRAPLHFIYGAALSACIVSTLAVSEAILGGAPSGIWVNGHPVPRVTGPLEGPNQLAGYLEAALPILWICPLASAAFGPLRSYAMGVSAAAMVLTLSRAGLLVAGLSYAALWRLRRGAARVAAWPMGVGTVVGFGVSTAWFVLWAHSGALGIRRVLMLLLFEPGPAGGVGTRLQLWPAALQLFSRHPVLGVGAGNYEMLLPTVGLHGIQTHAGSLWLTTLAEQGLVGIAVLILFAIVSLRETFARRDDPLGLAAFLAIASLLVHQVFDDLFFFPKVAALAWLLLGAGTARALTAQTPWHGNGRVESKDDAAQQTTIESSQVIHRTAPITDST